MKNNIEALEEVVKFIYDNIQYAEFNTKSDYCHVCGFDGEIILTDPLGIDTRLYKIIKERVEDNF
jgi:ribonucleoside-triphosphate reductase